MSFGLRLFLGLFEISSYNSSSPSPAGHPVIPFSGRLVSGDEFPFAQSQLQVTLQSLGVHRPLEVFGVHPSQDARLSRNLLIFSQVKIIINKVSGRA